MKSFDALWIELNEKVASNDSTSGTVLAVASGVLEIGKKILEEAGEVWLAAEHESDAELSEEISQLLYHLQVLMLARGLSLNDVYKFL